MELTKDLVDELYDSCKSQEFYNDLVEHVTRSVTDLSLFLLHLCTRNHGTSE